MTYICNWKVCIIDENSAFCVTINQITGLFYTIVYKYYWCTQTFYSVGKHLQIYTVQYTSVSNCRCMTTGWMTCTWTTDWLCPSTPALWWSSHNKTSGLPSTPYGMRHCTTEWLVVKVITWQAIFDYYGRKTWEMTVKCINYSKSGFDRL